MLQAARIAEIIKRDATKIAERWTKTVRHSKHMKEFQRIEDDRLTIMNARVYEHLATWLQEGAPKEEVAEYFLTVAKRRFQAGIPLVEAHYAFYLSKREIWHYLQDQSALSDSLSLVIALDMLIAIYDYFDLGSFYVTRGYLEAMYGDMAAKEKIKPALLNRYFLDHQYFKEERFSPDEFHS